MRQCICQICVCGRHRCGHKHKRRVPFAKDDSTGLVTTEHKERYQPFGFQPRQKPIKPISESKWKGEEPTVKLSTTKKDFVPFPIKKRSLIRPKDSVAPKSKMTDLNTTYQKDYIPKKGISVEKAKIPEPEGKNGTMPGTLPGKMEAVTTYNRCYTPKPFEKTDKATVKKCTLTEFDLPFTGVTETALSYKCHPYQKREKILPNKSTLKPEGKFTDVTTHQTDFIPKYVVPERPGKKKYGRWKPGEGKFESDTTHKLDYKCPLPSQRAVACAPKPEIEKSGGPFEGKSHYKQDYRPYEISQRAIPKWHPLYLPYQPTTKPFEGETTYRIDYESPPEEILQYVRNRPLKSNLTIASGPMEKLTTFMRDYRKIDCPMPTKSFKPDVLYEKPKEKFAGCTITNTDYTPKKTDKRQPCIKGMDNLKTGIGLMDNMTMTMKDFQWLATECPATYIKLFGKDALPNYEFEKTEDGHDFFKKRKNKKDSKKEINNKTWKQARK